MQNSSKDNECKASFDHMYEHKDENESSQRNETNNLSLPASPPPQPSFAAEEQADFIRAWLKQPTYREGRRFLEAHPELLTPGTDDALMHLGSGYFENGNPEGQSSSQKALSLFHHSFIDHYRYFHSIESLQTP